MPKLAIIDQVVSAGGVERFLHGLVGGMLELPEVEDWDITILLNRYNSGGYEVKWPEYLKAPNIHVDYMFDDRLGRLMNRLANPRRIWNIWGTGFAQSRIPWLFRNYGIAWSRRHAGDARLWIEHYCRQQQFDVAYFSYPFLMGCPRIPMPMVATPHDFNWKRFNTFGSRWCDEIEHQMPEWLRSCRRLVVSSEFMASELRHFYPEFADKVRVVRLGMPSSAHIPTEVELKNYRQRLGLPEQFLLTVGWIVPHKNQKVLFEALGLLRQKGVNIPLVCVGPNSAELQPANTPQAGGYVKEVLNLADSLDLQYGRDFFGLGYVNDFELECLYRLASMLVMPTLYEAGSGPSREALRAGCPLICSNIPPLVEELGLLVGNNVWMFEPSDHRQLSDLIQEVLTDAANRQEKAKKAAWFVTEVYSYKRAASEYLTVFSEALK